MVPIISKDLKIFVAKALEDNIIYYNYKKPNEFTERLVALMKTACLRQKNSSLDTIFVPKEFITNLEMEDKLINRFIRENYSNIVLDIKIVPVDYDILSDYHQNGCLLPCSCQHVVVGVDITENKFLLGSY